MGDLDMPRVAGGRSGLGDRGGAVLLVGFDAASSQSLRTLLAPRADVLAASTVEQGLRLLAAREIAVLCLGEGLPAAGARRFLDQVKFRAPENRRSDVVLAAGSDPELFQDLVDDDRLYYLTPRPPPLADVETILESALARSHTPSLPAADETDDDWALGARSVLELTARLATATRPGQVAVLIAGEAERLLDADDSECLIHDPADESLWTPQPSAGEGPESTAAGLVGFVARTGRAVRLARVGQDPRYDPGADNGRRSPDERFLAVPVAVDGRVMAVTVVLRRSSRPAFSERDLDSLELLAGQVAPVFGRLALQAQLDERTAETKIFRREALDHHARGFGGRGTPLQLSPSWAPWVFRLLVLVFAVAALYALLGSIHEYAVGPAVVRLENRTDVTSKIAGTVAEVAVEAGRPVAAGELLVRFHEALQIAELERIGREFELGLIRRLRDPSDPGAAGALSTLRAQQELARARLEERSLRAPHDGFVSDLRVRPGQHLSPGQVALTLAGDEPELGIVAFFPGRYRPLLQPGMALRLELEGYRYAYQHLVIDRIGDEVIGPAEARRLLGVDIGDAVAVTGPVVWAWARLPAESFESGDRLYRYHDGIQGTAEVRVRKEKILPTLVPGLKALWRGSDG